MQKTIKYFAEEKEISKSSMRKKFQRANRIKLEDEKNWIRNYIKFEKEKGKSLKGST